MGGEASHQVKTDAPASRARPGLAYHRINPIMVCKMRLPDLQRLGILESTNWKRWLANGELEPVIKPSRGTPYDFTWGEVTLLRLFEILVELSDLETARNGIILARQKLGVGSPIQLTLRTYHEAFTIQIDLTKIENEVARYKQAA